MSVDDKKLCCFNQDNPPPMVQRSRRRVSRPVVCWWLWKELVCW